MPNGSTWEEETLSRLREARDKQKHAQEIIKDVENDIKYWGEYASSLERTIELYRKKQGIDTLGNQTLDAERLRTQSTWANLVDIISANNGLLVVIDAVTILVEAKVFADREHARNVIYSTLNSHKRDVEWIRQGMYRLRKQGERIPKQKGTGLKQAILELKTVNPDMSKKDIKQTLVKRGFDFKGKKPGQAIHMAWVNLGYAKKEKQPNIRLLT